MAGGIEWFRWHHGSVNDQKFQLVAKKAGVRVADVIACWACLLEAASMAEDRGNPGAVDFEAVDCAMGFEEGTASQVYRRMSDRGLIDEDGRIAAWHKRQPKREDETANERKRRQREREHELEVACVTPTKSQLDTQGHDASRDVTQGHSRVEERRINPIVPFGFERFWQAYPKKTAKPVALKSWEKLKPDESLLAEILTAIERARATEQWLRENGKFIPHPATWLNQRRWEDRFDEVVTPKRMVL